MNLQFLISLFISFALVVGGANTAFASIAPGTDVGSAEHSIKGSDGFSVSLMVKSERNGLAKIGKRIYFYKNGKKFKGWKTVKSKRYYFKSNGRAATGSCKIKKKYYVFNSSGALVKAKKNIKVIKVGKSRYLVDSKGVAVKGWNVISGKLYYASVSGKCAANKTVDKVPFNSYGYAKPNNNRTKLLIEATGVVSKITNNSMSRLEKLKACFIYADSFRFIGTLFPDEVWLSNGDRRSLDKMNSGWQIEWALESLKTKRANCYGMSCAFAALAKVLGEDPYLASGPYRPSGYHICVRINGLYWDNAGDYMNSATCRDGEDEIHSIRFW